MFLYRCSNREGRGRAEALRRAESGCANIYGAEDTTASG
jgi:hypothetical protein